MQRDGPPRPSVCQMTGRIKCKDEKKTKKNKKTKKKKNKKKTGHFGVLRNKSSDANISTHASSATPSCFGKGHVTVLSTPPRNTQYSGVRQHRCSSTLDFCSACSEWKE